MILKKGVVFPFLFLIHIPECTHCHLLMDDLLLGLQKRLAEIAKLGIRSVGFFAGHAKLVLQVIPAKPVQSIGEHPVKDSGLPHSWFQAVPGSNSCSPVPSETLRRSNQVPLPAFTQLLCLDIGRRKDARSCSSLRRSRCWRLHDCR